jgi:hypothetical protein
MTKKPKAGRSKGKSAKLGGTKKRSAKIAKTKRTGPKRAGSKAAAPQSARAFRFTAADTVQIRFAGEKKPEAFRVDDMAEVSLNARDGQTRLYYQFRLVSNDRQQPDRSERYFWLFDPKPVGAPDPIAPVLWRTAGDPTVDGHDAVPSHSGNFSTRSVTSYDGSGACHVVKLDGKSTYRMRFDFNGKREFCDSLTVAVGKGDVLSVAGS